MKKYRYRAGTLEQLSDSATRSARHARPHPGCLQRLLAPRVRQTDAIPLSGRRQQRRISQSIDSVAGETVNYTYDLWNRLGTTPWPKALGCRSIPTVAKRRLSDYPSSSELLENLSPIPERFGFTPQAGLQSPRSRRYRCHDGRFHAPAAFLSFSLLAGKKTEHSRLRSRKMAFSPQRARFE